MEETKWLPSAPPAAGGILSRGQVLVLASAIDPNRSEQRRRNWKSWRSPLATPFAGGNGTGGDQFRRRRHAISRSLCETVHPRIEPHAPGQDAGGLMAGFPLEAQCG